MKRRKSNGKRGNGEARTHELLSRIAHEMVSMRKEMGELRKELRTGLEELRAETRETNVRIGATNERIDHLIDILAPKLKDHEKGIARLEPKDA